MLPGAVLLVTTAPCLQNRKDFTTSFGPVPQDAEQLAELARLLARDVRELSDEELIEAARASGELTKLGPERTGRLLAELYGRDRLSWPRIAELVGLPMTTVYSWARPYLAPDSGDERSPRQGRSTK
jgi:hypothetical protein